MTTHPTGNRNPRQVALGGFTLIELLVVISIIALLMSIMMPALARVKKQSQSVACMARLRSWGMAYKLYTDDYDGKFQPGWDVGLSAQWLVVMRTYYDSDDRMLLCPTATRTTLGANDSGTWKAWERDMGLPGGGQYHFVGSYGGNNWTDNMTQDRGDRLKAWFWRTTQNVKSPDRVPVLGDSTWHDAWPRDTDVPVKSLLDFKWGDQGTTNEINHFCIDRHNGWTNTLFMDWSVRHAGLKELWTLKWHRNFNVNGPWTKAGGVLPSDWPPWLQKYRDY
jgi:prepilin-type N-terminal cleavage/methylation domain-containing protein/prepilin-type processing-associated H-X9-DG protein